MLTLEAMRADVAEILGEAPEEIGDQDNLADLGLDSMRVMTLLARWNEEAGVALEFADIAEHLSLAGWWRVLEERRGG